MSKQQKTIRHFGFACGYLIAVVALSLFVFAPDARSAESLTELEMVGRYTELEKAAQEKLINRAGRSTSVLAPLCLAYSRLKQYGRLFPCLNELAEQIQSGDTTIETDKALISASDASPFANMLRAEAYVELGNYGEAIDDAKTAISRIRDRMPYGMWPPTSYRLTNLGTLALAYALAGDRENAGIQLKLLEDFPIGFMGSAGLRPLRANAVARAYMALGEYQRALPYVEQDQGPWFKAAWFLNDTAWGFSGDDSAETRLLLPKLLIRGKCLLETGNLGAAKTSLEAALRNARIRDYGELYWIALFERGRIAEKEGKAEEAIEFYKRAVEVIELQRSTINTEANKIGFVGDKQAVYHGIISALFAAQHYPDAFNYLERSKSRALVDMLAKQQDFATPTIDETKVRALLAQANQAEMDAASLEPAQDKPEHVAQRKRTSALMRQAIAEASPELGSLISVSSTPIADIQARLPEDEALVEYYYDDKSLFVFVLTRQMLRGIRLESSGLESEVRALRKAIEQPGSDAYLADAQRLHARLIRPIESIAGKEKLTIVAHGALHYLPFAALHSGTQFLNDKYALRFLPSASVMKYIRVTKLTKPAGILAFGNPDLGDPKYDLRFAQEEAVAVVQTVPQSKALVRKDATESALQQYAAGFQYLHFATHGEFDMQSPLRSALLLAKDASSDGLLTVGKLYSMRLDADLVTLSACETGLGKVASGDDVIGLTRGFLYAGASTVVASLWQVDDRATAELMTRFYDNLKGNDKREALRQAQIGTRQKYPHPFFWAAFQLTGSAL